MKIIKTLEFNIPARKLWSIVRRFDSGEIQYALGTLSSVEEVDGHQVRTFVNIDGSKTKQLLLNCDDVARIIEFDTIETSLPVSSSSSLFQVHGDDNGAKLSCTVTCEPDGASEDQVAAMFDDAWRLGATAFRKRIESGR